MAEANTSGAQQAQDAQNFDNQNSLSQPGSDAGASPGGRVGDVQPDNDAWRR